MKSMKILLGLIILSLAVPSLVFAQKGKEALDRYDDYYDGDKFDLLAGDDGKMTQADWEANRASKEARAFGDLRWDKAIKFDKDGDGALSLEEAKAYKRAERKKLIANKGGVWKRWKNRGDSDDIINDEDFSVAAAEDAEFLDANPDVARRIQGKKYLREHPRVREALERNPNYFRDGKNKKVRNTLIKERKYFKAHPELSKKAYKHREKLNAHPKTTKKLHRAAKEHPRAREKIIGDPDARKRARNKGTKAVKNRRRKEGIEGNRGNFKGGKTTGVRGKARRAGGRKRAR